MGSEIAQSITQTTNRLHMETRRLRYQNFVLFPTDSVCICIYLFIEIKSQLTSPIINIDLDLSQTITKCFGLPTHNHINITTRSGYCRAGNKMAVSEFAHAKVSKMSSRQHIVNLLKQHCLFNTKSWATLTLNSCLILS